MISQLIVSLILLPTLVMANTCPTFQSIIQLNHSITGHLHYAIVADGNYYLVGDHNQNHTHIEPTGQMPTELADTRLTVLIDQYHCTPQRYYLLSLQSFESNRKEMLFSTLDLMNWNQSTKWTQPTQMSNDWFIFKTDPHFKTLLDLMLKIKDHMKMIINWSQMNTIFVVIGPAIHQTSQYLYYTIDTSGVCNHQFNYSAKHSLKTSLTSITDPLDICFHDYNEEKTDHLIYCLSNDKFQVYAINTTIFKESEGFLTTQLIGSIDEMPTIDKIAILANICKKSEQKAGVKIRLRDPNVSLKIQDMSTTISSNHNLIQSLNISNNSLSLTPVDVKEVEERKPILTYVLVVSSMVLIIIAVAMFVVLVIQKRNQTIERM
ncbi:uncharacterized protein LOC128960290 [Oppia nitens]|uniref:uncharacterized protein LOC128960290 n=1 Tax=Oppia nitens TaxID=1686743 RepID=UPI0023DCE0C4|nr:uncharacterized protein LOC128960290 [Oppia nitens]